MIKRAVLSIAVLFVFLSVSVAQINNAQSNTASISIGKKIDSASIDRSKAISFQLLYLLNGGMRIDYDMRLKAPNQWLTIGPQFYYIAKEGKTFIHENVSFEEITGFGLDLQYRYYLSGGYHPKDGYIGGGITYQYHNAEFPLNGREDTYNQSINKGGVNFILGYQVISRNHILMDFYGGVGYRNSWYNANNGDIQYISERSWDFGYNGVLFLLGIRFGAWL